MKSLQPKFEIFDLDKEIEQNQRNEARKRLRDWKRFYNQMFGFPFNLNKLDLPPWKPGFNEIVVVHRNVDLKRVMKALEKHCRFDANGIFRDPDAAIDWNARSAERGSYAIRVERLNAAVKLRDLSAMELDDRAMPRIGFLEYLLWQLKEISSGRRPLDQKGDTRCDGTYLVGDAIPTVSWRRRDQSLQIGFAHPTNRHPFSSAREIVEPEF